MEKLDASKLFFLSSFVLLMGALYNFNNLREKVKPVKIVNEYTKIFEVKIPKEIYFYYTAKIANDNNLNFTFKNNTLLVYANYDKLNNFFNFLEKVPDNLNYTFCVGLTCYEKYKHFIHFEGKINAKGKSS